MHKTVIIARMILADVYVYLSGAEIAKQRDTQLPSRKIVRSRSNFHLIEEAVCERGLKLEPKVRLYRYTVQNDCQRLNKTP